MQACFKQLLPPPSPAELKSRALLAQCSQDAKTGYRKPQVLPCRMGRHIDGVSPPPSVIAVVGSHIMLSRQFKGIFGMHIAPLIFTLQPPIIFQSVPTRAVVIVRVIATGFSGL